MKAGLQIILHGRPEQKHDHLARGNTAMDLWRQIHNDETVNILDPNLIAKHRNQFATQYIQYSRNLL